MITEELIYKWQTMIGAFLGPFLAVVLSAIVFWVKSIIENKKERKEFLRRIEISVTRSLNDACTVREQLKWFSGRVKNLAAEARAITDDKIFFLNRINFPAIAEVYRDMEMVNFKVKSYYLHNKLLWIDAGIKEMNETISNLKNDFEDLIRQNEILIAVMRSNPNPRAQRETYDRNLETFAEAINEYIPKGVQQGIRIMIQIKVYNEQIRKRYGCWFWWKHEGTKFKYFRNKIEQKEFTRNLDSLDRIDKTIQKKVEFAIAEAKKRSVKLSKNQE
ncbi:hypothetical protein KJ854_04570 [Patescibacteria group bacterium]|nr:hypothetical protein [Patescibacteria group bacterium]